ncbi:MAG: DUF4390 domain-containing protein [Pseudomonadota bacterium]
MNSIAPTSHLTRNALARRLSARCKDLTRPDQLQNCLKIYLKNRFINAVFLTIIAIISITTLMMSTAQASDEIKIISASHYLQDQKLFLDSQSLFNLPEAIVNAINHEIPLTFKTEIRLSEKTRRLGFEYERTRVAIEYQTRLYVEGVNQRYFLYNTRNLKEQSFTTLESALLTLGTLQSFPVINLSELHPKQHYTLKIRISLDHWQLPAPLLIESLFKEHWQLDSGWYELSIQTPGSWL